MTKHIVFGLAALGLTTAMPDRARAQNITGYSVIQESWSCPAPPPGPSPGPIHRLSAVTPDFIVCTPADTGFNVNAAVYSQTAEDYTAALYYDVQSATGEFYNISNNPVASQTTNPTSGTASTQLSYYYPNVNADGIYSETTSHVLTFFYVTASGGYYDPYGVSQFTNGSSDGGYGNGYWFYINAIGLYIQQASVLLGQTVAALNHISGHSSNSSSPSSRSYSVAIQTFIPGQNAQAPYSPPPTCGPLAYMGVPPGYFQGDNRSSMPTLGSYRTLERVTLGLGGVTPPTTGVKDTGYTHLFANDAIQNGLITQAAMADTTTGDCHYLIRIGKAGTDMMTTPSAYGSGTSSAYTVLSGQAGNPLAPSGPISWNGTVRLTQTSPTTVHVTGSMYHKCFPAYEVSVGNSDVDYAPPSSSDFTTIASCLSGFGSLTDNIDTTLTVAP